MKIIAIIFQIFGSLGFLLYGMKLMSNGIQKSAGQTLHRILGFMTNNRVMAVLTGALVTLIIQSSSASTVMVVSFVNAGLLTLQQSIGVIFGANIGTTGTAWLVSLIGFKFNIAAFAIPAFGIGFIFAEVKRLHLENFGEALMGFGLLFLGLEWLSNAIPDLDSDSLQMFLTQFSGTGIKTLLIGVLAGAVITAIINSSSAVTAIIITMAYSGLLTFEFAAALTLGSNIGTTTDAPIASIGASANAQRAAFVHVMFNVAGTIITCFFFRPLLWLVDVVTPGTVEQSIGIHVAMFHTIFNMVSTIVFLPFVRQIALAAEKIIPEKKDTAAQSAYHFEFVSSVIKDSAEAHIIRAEKEIADMTMLAHTMFSGLRQGFSNLNSQFIHENMEKFVHQEDYADQMKEEISKYLLQCSELPLDEKTKSNIPVLINIVNDLENMTDDCFSAVLLLKRSIEKNLVFEKDDFERLLPYTDVTQQFLDFIYAHINRHLSVEALRKAEDFEHQIDTLRKELKKLARKRLKNGTNVKTELLYIDLVRKIENIGDGAFSISEELAQIQ
ncbi:phosphate:sodium symporter [Spirochaetia bacterium]|nr:phosphate:sodium symporter [Spirochaetia bacterium]